MQLFPQHDTFGWLDLDVQHAPRPAKLTARCWAIDTETELSDFSNADWHGSRGAKCSELNRHVPLLTIDSAPKIASDRGDLLWPQSALNGD
jgi:hypothetical protein